MYIFPFTRIRYIKTITINTHIDCANNSKCSVGDILLATKQGAFESVFGTFSVIPFTMTPKTTLNEQGSRTVNVRYSTGSTMQLTLAVFVTASGKKSPLTLFSKANSTDTL